MKDLMKSPVLVTGATGFIGANLTRRLADQNVDVHVTIRKESDTWRIGDILKDIEYHTVDLTDTDSTKRLVSDVKPGAVFHCAVYGGYASQTDIDKILRVNVGGTANLLNALSEVGCDCFINTDSSSEYGIKAGPMKETDPLEPVTVYGMSKATMTALCQAFGRTHGISNITLRPFSPYGPYDGGSRLISTVIMACLSSRDPKLSGPDAVRDFVFIDDVIDAYMLAAGMYSDLKNEVVNIGSGRQYSVGEAAAEIIDLTSTDVSVQWGVVDNPRKEPGSWSADISHAERLLGWKPRHSLRDGLKKTIEWFRAHPAFYAVQSDV